MGRLDRVKPVPSIPTVSPKPSAGLDSLEAQGLQPSEGSHWVVDQTHQVHRNDGVSEGQAN